jgi:hypothetical protein
LVYTTFHLWYMRLVRVDLVHFDRPMIINRTELSLWARVCLGIEIVRAVRLADWMVYAYVSPESISIVQLPMLLHDLMARRFDNRLTWLFEGTLFRHMPPGALTFDDVVGAVMRGRHCAMVSSVLAV